MWISSPFDLTLEHCLQRYLKRFLGVRLTFSKSRTWTGTSRGLSTRKYNNEKQVFSLYSKFLAKSNHLTDKCQNKWINVTNRAIFEISDQETVSPENEKEISEEHRGVKNAEETNKKCNSNDQVPSSPSKQRTINQYNDHF